ncbi:mechanosensitive ion channel family protein [Ovoidimarina sediminis]|uniref:mechanosensitive ion channel family protein n=1 Tax=Ovoidimarina sediminis TaxID=3079856 RepID=UPI00291497FD|nr:mechanosensitive ion channel domain-containing protein [Rhodophyticola sp. MJ-SS7]MDU8943946.1 mechanosensitive ion channel [Rhodophyticola sp. MJ-SS7]
MNSDVVNEVLNTDILGTSLRELLSVQYLLDLTGNIVAAIAILLIGLFVSGWISRRIRSIGGRNRHLDITLFSFLGNIARYVILGLTALIILNTFGVRTTSVVAVIGAAGLAIGLALQGTLSNVAAGVMIVFFRPFKVGDFVVIDGQMGTVKDITLNFTELSDLSNVQIIIPNANVWGNTITNYSAYPERRVEWVFGVSYGANLAQAEKIILDTIISDPRARAEPEPFIQVTNLGDFSVDFTVRVWCAAGDFWGFKTDMTRRVKEALDTGGIEIPFPTQTVYRVGEAAE